MSRKHEKEPNHERWLLTYSDLITLLMIFFVVMYATSNVDANKYKAVMESFNIAMGGGKSVIPLNPEQVPQGNSEETVPPETGAHLKTEAEMMKEVKAELDKYLQENGLKSSVQSVISERGLVVSLNDTVFFDSGRAIVKSESRSKLVEIGKIINKLGNYIRIEGHTDNVPISNYEFKSNWQLSAIRATTVTELLISDANIAPSKISAVGYGEYRPIEDNSTEQGRAKNRRVDLVILSSKFNGTEDKK